jgi:hypothetical protein
MRRALAPLASFLLACGPLLAATPPVAKSQAPRPPAALAAPAPFVVNEASLTRLAAAPVPLPAWVTQAQRTDLAFIARLATRGDVAGAEARWRAFLSSVSGGASIDINELIQYVLRESYLETTQDLADYAEKLKYYNKAKEELQQEVQKARSLKPAVQAKGSVTMQVVTGLPAGGRTVSPTPTPAARPARGFPLSRQERTLTAAQLDRYVNGLEKSLDSLNEDAQLWQLKLHDAMRQQQQAIRALTIIAKKMNDTAKAIIQNMK